MKAAKSRSFNKSDLSRKRKKKRDFKFYLYIFSAVLFVAGAVSFFRMDAFQIENVKVVGANIGEEKIRLEAEKLLVGNYLFIIPHTSVFFYPEAKITSFIRTNFPEVSKVDLTVNASGLLEIEIAERSEAALWCRANECFLMDLSGFVFSPALHDADLVKYRGIITGDPVGQTFGKNNFFKNLNKTVNAFNDIGLKAESVNIEGPNDVELYTTSGFVFKFLVRDIEDPALLENIDLFLGRMKDKTTGSLPAFEYIDARYGNKIFYKLR